MVKIQRWKKKILDLIYPPRCPVCHDIVKPGYEMICKDCAAVLPVVTGRRCARCGKPILEGAYCYDCQQGTHEFDQGIGIFLYEEVMRKSISYFKYMGRREYGAFYGMAAWKYGQEMLERWNPQVLIPVPIHISRKIKRGYNQAEIIADALAKKMKVPVVTDAVVRVKKTKAQKDLSQEERKKNLEHAFSSGKGPFLWKRVLLIDDIYTTGSTVDALARVLREAGAEEIYVLSVCIGQGFMVQ